MTQVLVLVCLLVIFFQAKEVFIEKLFPTIKESAQPLLLNAIFHACLLFMILGLLDTVPVVHLSATVLVALATVDLVLRLSVESMKLGVVRWAGAGLSRNGEVTFSVFYWGFYFIVLWSVVSTMN